MAEKKQCKMANKKENRKIQHASALMHGFLKQNSNVMHGNHGDIENIEVVRSAEGNK